MRQWQGCSNVRQTTYESAAKLSGVQPDKDVQQGKDAVDALAGKDPLADKGAGGAQAGQCVRDALLADCISPWRPSSTCRTSSTAGDLELKDISFPFQWSLIVRFRDSMSVHEICFGFFYCWQIVGRG